jgi:hypothetical protein
MSNPWRFGSWKALLGNESILPIRLLREHKLGENNKKAMMEQKYGVQFLEAVKATKEVWRNGYHKNLK